MRDCRLTKRSYLFCVAIGKPHSSSNPFVFTGGKSGDKTYDFETPPRDRHRLTEAVRARRERDAMDSREVGFERRVAALERSRKDSRRERLEMARAVKANTESRLSARRQQRYYEQPRYYAPRERHSPRTQRPY